MSPQELRDRVQRIITPPPSLHIRETTRWRIRAVALAALAPIVLPRWDDVRRSLFRQVRIGSLFAPTLGNAHLFDDPDFDPFAETGDDPSTTQRRDAARKLEACVSISRLPYDVVKIGEGKSAPLVTAQPPLRLPDEQAAYEALIECCRDLVATDNAAALVPFIRDYSFNAESREIADDLFDFYRVPFDRRSAFFTIHKLDPKNAFRNHFLRMDFRRPKGTPRWLKFYGLPDDVRARLEKRQLHLIQLERNRAGIPPANPD